jgi:cytochrome b561
MSESTQTLRESIDRRVPAKPSAGYTRTAIALHWLMAALITAGFTLGFTMMALYPNDSTLEHHLFDYHKWVGITVLGLVLVRSVWRLTHAVPPDEPMPRWQARIAHATHWLLYALMILQPLTGWMYDSAYGFPVVYLNRWQLPDLVPKNKELSDVLQQVHVTLAWTFLSVVLLHIAGALKHHFIARDATLRRMLGSGVRPYP